jgi:hypothetical protein
MGFERRRAPRFQLIADAEIVSPLSHSCLKARTSDLSLLGCFMNTIYSLPPGTEIQLQLNHAGATFTAIGMVVRSEPSTGFGVSFGNVKGAQQMLLHQWLEGLTAK